MREGVENAGFVGEKKKLFEVRLGVMGREEPRREGRMFGIERGGWGWRCWLGSGFGRPLLMM